MSCICKNFLSTFRLYAGAWHLFQQVRSNRYGTEMERTIEKTASEMTVYTNASKISTLPSV